MNSISRFMRPLLFGAVAVALVTASGCHWFKHKSTYAASQENRPLEVPPDLDLPDTSAATPLPAAASLGSGSTTAAASAEGAGFVVAGASAEVYPRVGAALEGIEGVSISGRAEALRSYDLSYQDQSFLVRVEDSSGGSRISAISADGRVLTSGPAAELLATLKAKL